MYFQIYGLLFLTSLSPTLQQCDEEVINTFKCFMLSTIRQLKTDGLLLPDIDLKFRLHAGSISLKMGDLTGLIDMDPEIIEVKAPVNGPVEVQLRLHYNKLVATYGRYDIKALWFRNTGKIVGTARKNTVDVHVTFFDSYCNYTLKVNSMNIKNFDIHLQSDSQIGKKVTNFIFSKVLNLFNTVVIGRVKNEMYKYIKSYPDAFYGPFCGYNLFAVRPTTSAEYWSEDSNYS